MEAYRSIEWRKGVLRLLDQRRLPHEIVYLEYQDAAGVAEAIRAMVIRGAPAIGAAAGYGLALAALHSPARQTDQLRQELAEAASLLRAARPTAVNLFYAIDRLLARLEAPGEASVNELQRLALEEAHAIAAEDAAINRRIGQHALRLLPDPAGRPLTFIHHCNTGALATTEYGTALGIIRAAFEQGREVFVYVDETRPRLQGARLTAWELGQLGIPYTVIVDGAAAHILRTRPVDLAVVGCDRVAANGDTANKIGTYGLALAAQALGVPFYVAAPSTTIDLAIPDGEAIPIEARDPEEVAQIGAERLLPPGSTALNLAFDVTPARYISAIITEAGVAYPPYSESLSKLKR